MGGMFMEEVLAGVMEKSVISGAFIFLLYYVVNNMKSITDAINNSNKNIIDKMEKFGVCLEGVGDTLLKIDMRIELLERRVNDLECLLPLKQTENPS